MLTLEDEAKRTLEIARDPARLQAEVDRIQKSAFAEAFDSCSSFDERVVLFSRAYGTEALPAFISFCQRDQQTLKRAAEDLERNRLGDLAAIVRAAIPSAKLKVPTWVADKRRRKRESRRAFLKALAKARRKP
jgi:hypothetical protein